VVRNRIRRQIQAILHPFLADLPQGWRFVIGVKSTGISCHSDQFLQELKQLFLDAEVFNGHS
jgi:ribonuclease P protein component